MNFGILAKNINNCKNSRELNNFLKHNSQKLANMNNML